MTTNAMPVVVVGGGPAGLSAALWLHQLGLPVRLLEQADTLGGLLNLNFLRNDWVLGFSAATGPEIAAQFSQHIAEQAIACQAGAHISRLQFLPETGHWNIDLRAKAEGPDEKIETIRARAVIWATGTRYRGIEVLADVPGLADISVRQLICGPHAFADLDTCAGQRILIVGGGDNALENAHMLLEQGAAHVTVVARSAVRAQPRFVDSLRKAADAGRAEWHEYARIASLALSADGKIVVGLGPAGQALFEMAGVTVPLLASCAVDRIHVLAGYVPNTDVLQATALAEPGVRLLGPSGHVLTDAAGRTGLAGLYAAGDVANVEFPCVVSAVASGARVARTVADDLRKPA